MSKNKKNNVSKMSENKSENKPLHDDPPPEVENCEKFQTYYED